LIATSRSSFVSRAIDLAHAAGTEDGPDIVLSKAGMITAARRPPSTTEVSDRQQRHTA
jgi:hypothetical protein